MATCDTCKHRTGWKAEYSRAGGPSQAVARCMSNPWPEWWKSIGERPVVTPGAGSACKRHEPKEPK